ncbi:MAG: agmatine deiminase family protein [Oligoflexales bacterium]
MKPQTPRQAGFSMPAEWAKHSSVWLAWPSHDDLWQETLPAAQEEFVALCQLICDIDPQSKKARGETLNVLVPTEEAGARAESALRGLPAHLHLIPFGDIWLRDTAPLFLKGPNGPSTVRFGFNGWGGKYVLEHDSDVSARIAEKSPGPHFQFPWVLEGGSVELDGEGLCLTTRQCLLNPNRNPSMDQEHIEEGLREGLGAEKILWLGDGLKNDHTDGHIDTIARFVGPSKVLCMKAKDDTDPNFRVMRDIERDLRAMTNLRGQPLTVGTVVSPGPIHNDNGDLMPASYLNFYIGNTTVVVPTYGSPMDQEAVVQIAEWFPGRRTVGSSAFAILSGGGAFHCISQQVPL